MTSSLLLTARTAVHLRPRQAVVRLLREMRKWVGPPRIRVPPRQPELRPGILSLAPVLAARLDGEELAPLLRQAERLRDGTFHAVGQSLPADQIDWTGRPRSHLFSYHLHYFDDAPGLAALARKGVSAETRLLGLWGGWLDACGSGGGDGWDPYPVSSRIPNWIQALVLLTEPARSGPPSPPPTLRERLLFSLWSQADLLRRSLEHDLQGNHLLRNRTALVWAAAALDPGPVDLEWAVAALVRELDRQVLPDGMHEERTPAYHALALDDLLRVIEVLRAADQTQGPGDMREHLQRLEAHARPMRSALRPFIRADGGLHPFGDTTPFGHPRPAALQRLAQEVLGASAAGSRPTGAWHLESAGFAGVRTDDLDLLLDCGPFGARHQPAHGHCDGLSFVLSIRGTPVVIDPGVAGYADDPHRAWARGTAAHNTVQIDGREQTEIWGAFRAARRAAPGPAEATWSDGEYRLHGAISPFHSTRILHRREVVVRAGEVVICDRVTGAAGRRLDTRIHFPPNATAEEAGDRRWRVACGGETVDLEVFGVDGTTWETGLVFPEWGRVEEGPVLKAWIEDGGDEEPFGFRFRFRP